MLLLNITLAALATLAPPTLQQDPTQQPDAAPIRIMLRARNGGADRLNPLRYIGGFETKTLLFETLVRRSEDGRIAPALASRWTVSQDKRAVQFELREGATFHDGSPVTSAAVCDHFQRWIGRPEHNWLGVNPHIQAVTNDGQRTFTVHLDRPYSLLADLCAINPCAIVGPTARDWEGEYTRPMGSGPFRFLGASADGKRWRIASDNGCELDVQFTHRGRDAVPIDALLHDEIDAFVGGWDEDLPAERLDELAKDDRFRVQTAPGSSVAYLSFRIDAGPTADVSVRRRIAAAIDRTALIADVEGGRASACTTWAAPSVAFWPRGNNSSRQPDPDAQKPGDGEPITLKLAAGRAEARATRIAQAVAAQLRTAGFAVELLTPKADALEASTTDGLHAVGTVQALDDESGEARAKRGRAIRAQMEVADVRVQITHGVPYDPQQSLVARFGPRAGENPDTPRPQQGVPARLSQLVAQTMAEPDETACLPIYAEIQALLDREALIVPLYSPDRVALCKRDLDGIVLGIDVYRVDLTGLRRR